MCVYVCMYIPPYFDVPRKCLEGNTPSRLLIATTSGERDFFLKAKGKED